MTVEDLAQLFATTLEQALTDPSSLPSPEAEWRTLGRRTAGLRRIYLDKNVWIWLRDAQMGRPRAPEHQQLLDGLVALVERGTHTCPASDVVFFELLGQQDRETRVATAEVIDRLSNGLALAPYDRRREIEFFFWLMHSLEPGRHLGDPVEQVWLPLFHLLGPMVPHDGDLSEAANQALQHAWLKASSAISLAEMIRILPEPPELDIGSQAFADKMSAGKDDHAHEAATYEELVRAELEGGVDSSAEPLTAAIRGVSRVLRGIDGGVVPPEVIRQYARLVAKVYEMGKLGDSLPTLQVAASYHAAIRIDRARRYKKGDWMDSLHAATALPYCQMLFTESALRHLLTTKPASLAARFGCEVVSNPSSMVEVVTRESGAS